MWPLPVASRLQILACGVEPDVQCYTAHANLARQLVLDVARLDLNLSLSDMQENAISQLIVTWINRSATPIYSPGGSRRPDYALYCVPLVRRGSRGRQRQGRQGRAGRAGKQQAGVGGEQQAGKKVSEGAWKATFSSSFVAIVAVACVCPNAMIRVLRS